MTRALPKRALAIPAAVALLGCTGPVVNVSPVLPASYSEVGNSAGEACGMLLFSMIPIQVNDRVERAYFQALESAKATSLTDASITERWYFALVGTVVCTRVEGLALRRVGGPAASQRGSRGETRELSR